MPADRLPQRVREYHNHHLDSTRWDSFRPRPDDIIISTTYKAGTTWMQRIVSLLVLGAGPLPRPLAEMSPWIDLRVVPLDLVLETVESQEHRRFVKTHLPFDALPYYADARYIFVARDTRDVFMSLFNHYHSHTDAAYEMFGSDDPEGGPLPRCPDDPREFWRSWITQGAFPWEDDGWPYWSHHYHASSYWEHRNLPNLLIVHYNDLTADLGGEMRRVAHYLDIDVPERDWPALIEAARFDAMKREAIAEDDAGTSMAPHIWKEGAASFFYKGTNGRWRDVLTDDDLELYEIAVERLDPELRAWLERGTAGAGSLPDR
jgi:aryl sulfotransferase